MSIAIGTDTSAGLVLGTPPGAEAFPPENDLDRLFELVTRLSATLDLETLYEDALCAVASLQGAGQGMLTLWDATQQALMPVVCIGVPEDFCMRVGMIGLGEGPSGRAARDRQPVLVQRVEDPEDGRFGEIARVAGHAAVCAVPLINRAGAVVGTIETYFRDSRQPSEREAHLVELFSFQLAQILTNAQDYVATLRAGRANLLLAEVSGLLLETLALQVDLIRSAQLLAEWFVEWGIVDILNEQAEPLDSVWIRRGEVPEDGASTILREGGEIAPWWRQRRSLLAHALRSPEPTFLCEVLPWEGEDGAGPEPPISGRQETLLLPLTVLDRPVAVLTLGRAATARGAFSREEVMLAREVARRIGIALVHSAHLPSQGAAEPGGEAWMH
jgi:GAF domain-containing protein